eukprot:608904-Hanusia_phi.AAC.6
MLGFYLPLPTPTHQSRSSGSGTPLRRRFRPGPGPGRDPSLKQQALITYSEADPDQAGRNRSACSSGRWSSREPAAWEEK